MSVAPNVRCFVIYNFYLSKLIKISGIFMLLKCTTRHIRIYTAQVENNELVESENVLTLDIDPDNEFNWNEDALQKMYRKFDELVEAYTGAELTEYNLRRIGSDLEHYMRSLLQSSQISYNLESRVLNYSMGLPQVIPAN
jgi:NAD(P)H-quinone oxidoreductase subunit M